jgi:hypothetical protein
MPHRRLEIRLNSGSRSAAHHARAERANQYVPPACSDERLEVWLGAVVAGRGRTRVVDLVIDAASNRTEKPTKSPVVTPSGGNRRQPARVTSHATRERRNLFPGRFRTPQKRERPPWGKEATALGAYRRIGMPATRKKWLATGNCSATLPTNDRPKWSTSGPRSSD